MTRSSSVRCHGEDIQTKVFLSHRIDERAIFIFINTDHFPTHLKVAIGICRIDNGKCNLGVALHIVIFLAIFGLTEEDIRAIPIEPDRITLWLSLWPNSCNMSQCLRLQKIDVLLMFFMLCGAHPEKAAIVCGGSGQKCHAPQTGRAQTGQPLLARSRLQRPPVIP